MAIPEGRDWRPGKPGEFDKLLKDMLEESIEAQRSMTEYKGPDEGWETHVANKSWGVDTYQKIGWNSGFIAATLNVVENMKSMVPESLVKEARYYIYGV